LGHKSIQHTVRYLRIRELRDIARRFLGADIEHRTQLLVRLQLAVKLRYRSPFAIDRYFLDQSS
jgi:hypothetical protein